MKKYIISISGISGSGKTTIATALKERLVNAEIISFDNVTGDWLGRDYCEWSESGADCNEANLSSITDEINRLSKEPLDYIIVDYPFGKAHREVSSYLNFSVWIDIPLDISLARRILRDFTRRSEKRRPLTGNISAEVSSYLDFYFARHRNTYFKHIETIKPSVDLIVDGTKSIDAIVEDIIKTSMQEKGG